MANAGVAFEDEWALKQSVVSTINRLTTISLTQREVWYLVSNSRKALNERLNFVFPKDPEFERKRTYCHAFEAWYAIALLCAKYDCLHLWLCQFNLSSSYGIVQAKRIIFDGPIIVNGLHVQGSGFIEL